MFVKLDCGILDSSLWAQSSDHAKLWVTLLAMADRDGFVGAALPAIARRAYLDLPATERIMADLAEPDPHSRSTVEEGRRVVRCDGGYRLVTFAAYRQKGHGEDRKEQLRAAQQRQRDKRKSQRPSAAVNNNQHVNRLEERRGDKNRTETETPPNPPEGGDANGSSDEAVSILAYFSERTATRLRSPAVREAILKRLRRLLAGGCSADDLRACVDVALADEFYRSKGYHKQPDVIWRNAERVQKLATKAPVPGVELAESHGGATDDEEFRRWEDEADEHTRATR